MNRIEKFILNVEEKPIMFLGRKRLRGLILGIKGIQQGIYLCEGIHENYFEGFKEYVENKNKEFANKGREWWEIIDILSLSEESAFDRFYQELHQFLKIRKAVQ